MKSKVKLPKGMTYHSRGIMGRTTVRYRDGVSKRETVYGRSTAEVADKLLRIKQDARKLADPDKRPLREFLDLWLDRIRPTSDDPQKPEVRYNTFLVRQNFVKRVKDDENFADTMLSELDERAIADFLKRARIGGAGSRTVEMSYEILRVALKWALKERWITEDLMLRVDKPVHKPGKKRSWSSSEHLKFVAMLYQPYDEAIFSSQGHRPGLDVDGLARAAKREHDLYTTLFSLLATTGTRIGEVLALRWENVEIDECTLDVVATLTRTPIGNGRHSLAATPPKTRESRRSVGISKNIAALMASLRGSASEGFVFTSPAGHLLDRRNVSRTFARFCTRAGVPKVTMHSLRGSVATAFVAGSDNLIVLTKSLGWTDPKTAAKYYTAASPEITGSFRDVMLTALASGVQSGVQKP